MYHARRSRAARAPSLALGLLLAASLGGAARTARAQLVALTNEGNASASLGYGGMFPPARTDQRGFGPYGGAAVAEVVDVFGRRTRGVQTGYGLNAVAAEGLLSDVPSFIYDADTDFSVRVGNGGASASEDLFFEYVINGGELRLRSPSGNFDGLVASVGSTIFTLAPGFSGFLWSWQLELRGVGGTLVVNESQLFGDPLGLGTPPVSAITTVGGEAVVSIGHFTGSAELGPLGRFDSALINYTMFASLSGPGFNATGGRASLGDPFDVDNAPGAVFRIRGLADLQPAPTTVPEPSAVGLIALGLAGMWLRRPVAGRDARRPAPLPGRAPRV